MNLALSEIFFSVTRKKLRGSDRVDSVDCEMHGFTVLFSAQKSARSRSRDRKFDAKTLKFFLDFQTKSDLKLFVTQHK